MQSLKDSITKQSSIFFMSLVFNSALQLVSSIIMARLLGPSGKGVVNLIFLFVIMGALIFSLGLDMSIVYHVSKNKYSIRELLPVVSFWSLIIVPVFAIVGFILFPHLQKTVLKGITFPLFVSGIFILCLRFIKNYIISIARGLQRIKQIAVAEICDRAGYVFLLIIFVVIFNLDVKGAVIAFMLISCIVLVILWKMIADLTKISYLVPRLRKDISSSLFNFGLKSYIGSIMEYFNDRIDIFLLNYFLGPAQVGIYMIAVTTTQMILFFPRSIRFVFFPKVASSSDISSEKMTMISRQTLMITALAGIVFVFIVPFLIPTVYGNSFKSAVSAILFLIPGIVILSLGWVLTSYLNGKGFPHYVSYITIITIVLKIILNIILIPKLGLIGIALVSSGTNILYTLCSIVAICYVAKISPLFLLTPKREDFTKWRVIVAGFLRKGK